MAAPDLTAMGIESFFVYNLLILHGLGKSEKAEIAVKSIILRHDVRSIAREASAAPAASLYAGHVQQLGGANPLPNLMEVKG